jgi:hypothetical protein
MIHGYSDHAARSNTTVLVTEPQMSPLDPRSCNCSVMSMS